MPHSSSTKSFPSPKYHYLVSSSATLHVLLEGLTLRDGLSRVIGDNWGGVTGVRFASHGPAHLLSKLTARGLGVRVDFSVHFGDKGRLGSRRKGRGGGNESQKSKDLLLDKFEVCKR